MKTAAMTRSAASHGQRGAASVLAVSSRPANHVTASTAASARCAITISGTPIEAKRRTSRATSSARPASSRSLATELAVNG